MKNLKILLLLTFALFAYSNAFANDDAPTSVMDEMTDILQSSFANYVVPSETKVLITFMLNSQNELLVYSTTDDTMDSRIKGALNYKTMQSTDLEKGQLYVLPLRVERQ